MAYRRYLSITESRYYKLDYQVKEIDKDWGLNKDNRDKRVYHKNKEIGWLDWWHTSYIKRKWWFGKETFYCHHCEEWMPEKLKGIVTLHRSGI